MRGETNCKHSPFTVMCEYLKESKIANNIDLQSKKKILLLVQFSTLK